MSEDQAGITLVTGASGFVGNNLVRHLLQLGRSVRALANGNNESLDGLDIERVDGDIREPAAMKRAMRKIDVVYHVAAAISIDNDERRRQLETVNVAGTANVVEACLAANVRRLIHFSSIHALSWKPKDQPIDETRELALEPSLHLPYDCTKANGEQRVLEGIRRGLDAVILNPVGIFGPGDFGPSPGGEFLLQLANRQLPGLVNGGYYWVDVRDVASAAVAAEHRGHCGARYILASEFATFQSIGRWVQEVTGAKPPRFTFPVWLAQAIAPFAVRRSRRTGLRPLITPESIQIVTCHQKIATTKARDELGFVPRPVRDSVQDAIRWLLERQASKQRRDPTENVASQLTTVQEHGNLRAVNEN